MIPDRYDLKNHATDDDGGGVRDESIYQGDTYRGALFTLPRDLSDLGGPADISDAIFTAQVRNASDDLLGDFTVDTEDIEAETVGVRPEMAPAESATLPATVGGLKAYWDLQAAKAGWVGTFVWGQVTIRQQRTH